MAAVHNQSPEEAVGILLEYGVNVDSGENMAGGTPLMSAVDQGKIEVIKLLIAAGADVNAINDWELSVTRIAEQTGNAEAVDILLEAGAHPRSGEWKSEFP